MKKIFLIIMILVSATYSQDFVQVDSILAHARAIEAHTADILNLLSGTASTRYSNTQIDQMFDAEGSERLTEIARLDTLIVALTLRVKALEDRIPVVITPQPPTDFEVHAISTTEITGTFTEPVDTGDYYIRMRIYSAQGDQLSYDNVDTLEHGITTFTVTGLIPNTTYQFDAYTVVEEVVSPSDFAIADTATTWQISTGGGGGVYESVIYAGVTAAGDGDGSSRVNQIALSSIMNTVVAGDSIILGVGAYNVASTSFNRDGTSGSHIVWIGTINATDKLYTTNTVDGSVSTLFYNTTSSANPAFNMNGDYNEFVNIVFQQNYDARQLVSISGLGVMIDSSAVKYPSNVSSSSNHTVVVTGKSVSITNTTFRNGSRCIIWVRKNSGTEADFFTMDNCIITHATNHPPIQIMPATNSTDTTTIKRAIVRNTLFIDNTYGDGIYSRYCEQFAFYNNLFINSDSPFNIDIHTGFHYPAGLPEDTCNSKGGIVAYNTIISSGQCNIIFNKGSNQVKFVNNVIYSIDPIPDMIFRLDGSTTDPTKDWDAIYRHQFDYNLYDYVDVLASGNGVRGTWGTGNTSVWYYQWEGVTGHEANTTIDITPTWNSTDAVGGYRPPNIAAPQTAKGIPVTIANGFFMNITTDYYGNTRDATNPTIGYSNYVGE